MTSERARQTVRAGLASAMAVVVSLAGSPSSAQEPSESDRALYRAARDELKAGHWSAACARFRDLMGRVPSAKVSLGVAQCLEQEGKVASSLAVLHQTRRLNDAGTGAAPEPRIEEEIVAAIARIEPRVPRLTVVVGFTAPGLAVTLDGKAAPLGAPMLLDPGPHQILATAPDFETEQRTVTLVEGGSSTERIVLRMSVLQRGDAGDGPHRRRRDPGRRGDPSDPSQWKVAGAPLWAVGVGAGGILFTGFAVGFAIDAAGADGDDARATRDLALAIPLGVLGAAAITVAVVAFASVEDQPAPGASWRLRAGATPREAGATSELTF